MYVGDDVHGHENLFVVKPTITGHQVVDWDDMQHLWQHAFKKLGVEPSEHTILATAPVVRAEKEKHVCLAQNPSCFTTNALSVQ